MSRLLIRNGIVVYLEFARDCKRPVIKIEIVAVKVGKVGRLSVFFDISTPIVRSAARKASVDLITSPVAHFELEMKICRCTRRRFLKLEPEPTAARCDSRHGDLVNLKVT